MRRMVVVILLSMSMIFVDVLPAVATTYTVTQLTNNSYPDGHNFIYGLEPHINANGQAVWVGRYGTINDANQEIFFFNGTSVIQLTNNAYTDTWPEINARGQVVWMGLTAGNNEIFFSDGTSVLQITEDTAINNWYPHLNDNGQIVWDGNGEIYLYSVGAVTRLTKDGYYDELPRINNRGQVVWQKYDGSDWEIFLYDGTSVIQLTDNGFDDKFPQLDDAGRVVWEGWDGTDYEIFFYDGTSVIQLTNNGYDDAFPKINVRGQVVWQGGEPSNNDIFLYDGNSVNKITSSPTQDYFPRINNRGQVVWHSYAGFEVLLYDGSSVTRITNDPNWDYCPQIDDSGRILWMKWDGTDFEIYLATPNSGQTPAGTDVPVTPVDPNPVVPETSVTVTFGNVTTAGETSVTSSGTGTPPPSGFKVGNPPVYFEISTTAVSNAPIDVCINYTGISFGNEEKVRLFHQTAGGTWEDVTTSVDTVNDIVCGEVSTLSPFVPLEADFQFTGFFPPIVNGAVNLANAGRSIPVKWQLRDGSQGIISDLAAVTGLNYQQISCAGSGNSFIMPPEDTLASGASGLRYDAATNQFIYTWKTDKSMVDKCYRLNVELFHVETRTADFEFE